MRTVHACAWTHDLDLQLAAVAFAFAFAFACAAAVGVWELLLTEIWRKIGELVDVLASVLGVWNAIAELKVESL